MFFPAVLVLIVVTASACGQGQLLVEASPADAANSIPVPTPSAQAHRFLSGRTLLTHVPAAQAMEAARRQHAALLAGQANVPLLLNLSAAWQPVGPNQIASIAYGKVTGRVTSIAIDPADTTGNTVYLGTTGGGVWKSVNAAGPSSGVTFAALTDTLPVFSANASTASMPSLSIGAVSVQSGVILAGTGDPNDASDSFYGGGILRSADGGLTWTLIQDSQDGVAGHHSFTGLGFARFAWSDASPGTVVAAVSQAAEGALVNAVDRSNSVMGLYYSTDAGITWQMSVIVDGSQTVQSAQNPGSLLGGRAATAVVWNPIRRRFYAAVRYHGYYDSPDGITWTRLTNQPGLSLSTTACPASPNTTGSSACPIFRGALAVQSTSGDLFALTVDAHNNDQGLWQDACAEVGTNCASSVVTFAEQLSSTPLEVGSGSTVIPQADYNLALAAVSTGRGGAAQDTLLYVGTIDLYRCSLNAGCLLRNTTNAIDGCAAAAQVAPAQHAIATLATSSQPLLYLGNDGGAWRSTDGVNQQGTSCSSDDATHFQNLNGGLGSLAEVVSFAQHPADPGTLLAGLGANGTAGTSMASSLTTAWPQLSGGEGGAVAIDPVNPSLWYLSTAAGVSIRQCAGGSTCTAADFTGPPTIGAAQTSLDESLIDAPWLLDPALPLNILVGTCRVWRGPAGNGALWSSSNAISRLLAGPQGAACAVTNPVLRSLAAGGPAATAVAAQNAGSQTIYAGMAGALDGGGNFGGHLFSTTTASTAGSGTVWTDLATSPVSGDASGFNAGAFDISSIVADGHDAAGATVYATVMGFGGNGIAGAHLYRSLDAGAHWFNISSNLPNAPANSVAVDPNDANTVYIAMDTGVYVTSAVSTCATANCWSVYGTSLPNAPVTQLAVAGSMPTGDGRIGELRAATYGRGIWQIPLLAASSTVQPAMSLNPASLTFAAQSIATASPPQTITVTNTGAASLIVSQIVAPGDFTEGDNCTSASIAPNSLCTIQIRFLPTALGTRSGVLTIYGNVGGGQSTASLSGNAGPAAAVVLNPIAVRFTSTVINATSPLQNITISNTGTSPLALQTPSITGDFRLAANTCGSSLGPGVGCTVSVAFAPTVSGTRNGIFTIVDEAGTQTASLIGIGTSPATDALSPLSLTFAAQQITTSSVAQQITLANSGDVPLTLIAAQITSGDFTVVNACGNSLNPHSTCSLGVAFQPKNVGGLVGVLSLSDQYRTQTISLNGIGTAPPGVSLAPFSTVSFAATGVGLTAAVQTITLTNNGGVPLVLQSIVLTGDFAIVSGSNTCGASLAVNTACTMQIVFVPTSGGPRTGTLTVTDNALSSPQTLRLVGSGVDFTLTPNGSASLTIANGRNAVFPLLLTSAANVTGTVAFSCIGIPANATCNITPASVVLGGTTTISLTVLTGVKSALSSSPTRKAGSLLWLAGLLPLGLLARRRYRLPRLISALLLCLLLAGSGCGAGRSIPLPNGTPASPTGGPSTPAGTYTVVASAGSAGLIRTVNLTLVVQ